MSSIVAEEVLCVLADRLEHPVAGVVPADLDGNERRANQFIEDVRRSGSVVVDKTAANASASQPPANTLIARNAA